MSKQITGNAGLYYACFRLSQLGWNAMPTSRNAAGIDIVVYNKADDCRLVQVKTISGRKAVPLGKSLERIRGDFWIIVVFHGDGTPKSFVMLPSEVRDRATRDKGGKQQYWLSRIHFSDNEDFCERWDRFK